jgi:hypothetical protein
MNFKPLVFLCCFSTLSAFAQMGGNTAFQNLNMQYNARTMGLGGDVITVFDSDVNLGINNPSIINKQMHRRFGFNQSLQSSGVNTGMLAYAHAFGQTTGMVNFRYASFGKMRRTDETGQDLGAFTPGDFVLGVSAQRFFNKRMAVGATLNLLYSQLDSYTAFGTSIDVAGLYYDSDHNFAVVGVVKNLGVQWKSYVDTRNRLPLEVQLGISHKLKHAPFRFSLVAQHLQKWNLAYNDPNAKPRVDPISGDTIKVDKSGFFDKLGRHFKVQIEVMIGKKIKISTAFDYQRRRELAIPGRGGVAGFSFGAGLTFKRFSIDYGWFVYSAAGGQHGLSVVIPLLNKYDLNQK